MEPSNQGTWRPRTLDVEVTTACNLACRYCYLGAPTHQHMNREIADLVRVWASRRAIRREDAMLNLYGGEPFLNWPVVQRLGGVKTAKVSIFTNGASATDVQIDWCKANGIEPRRSTAGCPEAATLTRPGGYTEKWLREGSRWADYGAVHRLVVTPATARYLLKSVAWRNQNGYYGPVDIATDDYGEWGKSEIGHFASQMRLLAEEFVNQYRLGNMLGVENFTQYGRVIFGQRGTVIGCGAGWETLGITWDGRVVACHRCFREPPDSPLSGGRLCDILSGGRLAFGDAFVQQVAKWAAWQEDVGCLKCPARYACARGCHHLSMAVKGRIGSRVATRCRFVKTCTRLALWINEQLDGERWWERKPTVCVLESRDAGDHD